MAVVSVTVQWGSQTLQMDCDTEQSVGAFMAALQERTGVPVANQKVMLPRRPSLKPDDSWNGLIKSGGRIMLIGTAAAAPVLKDVRIEEVEEAEEPDVGRKGFTASELQWIQSGLRNLGNKCFLNACLQTLRLLPGLADAVRRAAIAQIGATPEALRRLQRLIREWPQGLPQLVTALQLANAGLFAALDEAGHPMQQDSAECWNWLIQALQGVIGGAIEDQLGITFDVRNAEGGTSVEFGHYIPVMIDADVRELPQGVRLEGKAISRIPPILVFEMNRFEYKASDKITAKIVRRVLHPFTLDTVSWLSPDLRARVAASREAGGHLGQYRLVAVLTHRGRAACSGHYITHVLVKNQWWRFDDEVVTEVDRDAIEALAGSGDWHSSVLVIYQALVD